VCCSFTIHAYTLTTDMTKNSQNFMDITHKASDPSPYTFFFAKPATITYPEKTSYNSSVKPLAKDLKPDNMRSHLKRFTAFHTHYYRSQYDIQSAE
jgi:bacterial leucyl aminopeptidase